LMYQTGWNEPVLNLLYVACHKTEPEDLIYMLQIKNLLLVVGSKDQKQEQVCDASSFFLDILGAYR
jgi:hypothetical protein